MAVSTHSTRTQESLVVPNFCTTHRKKAAEKQRTRKANANQKVTTEGGGGVNTLNYDLKVFSVQTRTGTRNFAIFRRTKKKKMKKIIIRNNEREKNSTEHANVENF